MKILKSRHSVYLLQAHIVLIVKYRRKVLYREQIIYLDSLFGNILKEMGCVLIEFNGELDHVHIALSYPPQHSISYIVNRLKGRSSWELKRVFPDLAFNLKMKSNLWSRSYFAGSVGGATLEILKKYIENQDTPTH